MRKATPTVVAGVAALGAATSAFAATSHQRHARGHPSGAPASRLDDGKGLLRRAAITEQQAITAAKGAASGALDEVDLEYRGGTLVFNVDVGAKDVKVDAGDGHVVAVDQDD
jgi:uncharacterized membrane protein YkoI